MEENARIALNQAEYRQRYNALNDRLSGIISRLDDVSARISDMKSRGAAADVFVRELRKQGGLMVDFDERLWHNLLDYVTVYNIDDIRFTFKNGAVVSIKPE